MSLSKFVKQVVKNPLLISQSVQVAGLICTGDLIRQTIIEKKPLKEVDLVSTVKIGLLGVFIIGPTVSTWFRILALTVNQKDPYVAVKKMLLDQIIFAPLIMIPIFMTSVNIFVNGNSWEKTKEEIKTKYKDILITNYKIWPIVQIVNFNYVPIPSQVFVTQAVAVFWNTYLTWKTVKKTNKSSK